MDAAANIEVASLLFASWQNSARSGLRASPATHSYFVQEALVNDYWLRMERRNSRQCALFRQWVRSNKSFDIYLSSGMVFMAGFQQSIAALGRANRRG